MHDLARTTIVDDFTAMGQDHGFQGALLIEASSNPYYHTASDSLDTQDYSDYAFATGMTRSAVGFLAEKAEETPDPATASACCWLARSSSSPAAASGAGSCSAGGNASLRLQW